MKIIDRYLIINFINPFVYCLFLFLFLYVVLDLFGHVDEILKAKTSLGTLFQYYLSFVPIIFVQTTPIAALLATSYSIGNLKKNSELTAMRASGISVWRIVAPFVVCGFAASILTLVINDRFVPQATMVSKKIKEERIELKTPQEKKGVMNDVTLYGDNNRMFYVRTFDTQKNILKDMIILRHDSRNVIRERVSVQEARWIDSEWHFFNATFYQLGTRGQVLGDPVYHPQMIYKMNEEPKNFSTLHKNPDLMSFSELLDYIHRLRVSGYHPTREVIALHQKVALPFITFVAVILGIPAVLRTSNRGGGVWMGIVISIAVGLFVYVVMAICLSLGRAQFLPSWLAAWLTNIMALGAGGYFLAKSQ
jgi:lipopolysaccharide export system permease protein